MKNYLFIIIFIITNFNAIAIQDLSGLYDFENCSCTVLRCPRSYLYYLNQTQNGDFVIHYTSHRVANGKTTWTNNGQNTHVSIQWLPGMDFDTSCTGLWNQKKRSIELKCGDQYRYCTGEFKCRHNSGPCAKNSSNSLYIHYINPLQNIFISLIFVFFIKRIIF